MLISSLVFTTKRAKKGHKDKKNQWDLEYPCTGIGICRHCYTAFNFNAPNTACSLALFIAKSFNLGHSSLELWSFTTDF